MLNIKGLLYFNLCSLVSSLILFPNDCQRILTRQTYIQAINHEIDHLIILTNEFHLYKLRSKSSFKISNSNKFGSLKINIDPIDISKYKNIQSEPDDVNIIYFFMKSNQELHLSRLVLAEQYYHIDYYNLNNPNDWVFGEKRLNPDLLTDHFDEPYLIADEEWRHWDRKPSIHLTKWIANYDGYAALFGFHPTDRHLICVTGWIRLGLHNKYYETNLVVRMGDKVGCFHCLEKTQPRILFFSNYDDTNYLTIIYENGEVEQRLDVFPHSKAMMSDAKFTRKVSDFIQCKELIWNPFSIGYILLYCIIIAFLLTISYYYCPKFSSKTSNKSTISIYNKKNGSRLSSKSFPSLKPYSITNRRRYLSESNNDDDD